MAFALDGPSRVHIDVFCCVGPSAARLSAREAVRSAFACKPQTDQAARQPLVGGHQAAGPNRLLGVFWFAGCLNMRPGRRKRIIRTNCSSGGVTRLKTQTRQRRTHALQDHFASTTNDGNADGLSSRRRDDRQEPQSLINACGIACVSSPVVIMPRSAWPLSAACHRGRAARPDRPADRAPRRGP